LSVSQTARTPTCSSFSTDDQLCVVLITLSEPVAASFAEKVAESLAMDGRFEVIGAAQRRGWRGGAADILVRVRRAGAEGVAALDAAVDDAVSQALPHPALTLEAVVMVEVVPTDQVQSALAAGHLTMREALRGMGLY
jgi:hypothetical protein